MNITLKTNAGNTPKLPEAPAAQRPGGQIPGTSQPAPSVGMPPPGAKQLTAYYADNFMRTLLPPGPAACTNEVNDQLNAMQEAQLKEQGWVRSTPMIVQNRPDNCGPAVVSMLVRSKGGGKGRTDAELMREFGTRHKTDGVGTTAAQLSEMLAENGISVTKGASHFDQAAADEALRRGCKLVALVDSNLIQPGGDQKTGNAHWVVIDGMDKEGRYLVKDPARGTSSYVDAKQLALAMTAGWAAGDSGGMLILENMPAARGGAALGPQRADPADALGDAPGTGSNASSSYGRESSAA